MQTHYLYMIECDKAGHYYVGHTADLFDRLRKIFSNNGSSWTKTYGAKRLFIKAAYDTAEEAKAAAKALTIQMNETTGVWCAGGPFSSIEHIYALKRRQS